MRKLLLFLVAISAAFFSFSQTTLISPTGDGGFETGATFALNNWTAVNTATSGGSQWFTTSSTITTGTYSFVPTTSRAAFISNNAGVNWRYNTTPVATSSHIYKDITFPSGETKINLSFRYNVNGNDIGWDEMYVYLCPQTLTPVANSPSSNTTTVTWSGSGTATLLGTFRNLVAGAGASSGNIAISSAIAGNAVSNSPMRLVFTWKNDGTGGTEPPSAIDDVSLTSSVPSPLSGSYSINNTLITTSPMVHNGTGNFASFTDAINSINGDGLNGAVTFNVSPGQTFNENTPALTATGTVTNTIIFQKNGGGANPKITPSGSAGTTDFGLNITGGDYITFDGIDIEALNNTVEFGYYVINASTTNGATNNTIKNTKITLVNTIAGTVGLRVNTLTTPTSAAGANSNNLFKNLTISNAYRSIVISGNATFNDENNQVTADLSYSTGTNTVGYNDLGNITTSPTSGLRGIDIAGQNNLIVSKCETRNISSTILTGTSDVVGIIANTPASTNVTFTNNLVHDLTAASISTQVVYGIWLNGACVTGTTNITSNKIYKITGASTSTGSTRGILHNNSTTTGVVNITNNMIYQLESPKGTGAPGVRGIELNTAFTVNLHYNSVYLDAAYSGTPTNSFQTACLYMASSASTVLDMRNNIFVNNSTIVPGGIATRSVAFYKTTSTIGTQITTTSNANLWFAGVASIKNLIYYPSSAGGAQTLAIFKGNTTDGINNGGGNRENISVSENPPFISVAGVYDVHLNTSIATRAESGGIPVSTTTDFDGDTRNASFPDIGADEFAGIANDVVGPLINYTTISNTASTANRTFTGLATITDFSGVNTTSGKPRLYFKRSIDGNVYNNNTNATDGWKYVEASNASSPFDFTTDYNLLNLPTGVVGGNIIQYFVVAQDLATTPNTNINSGSFAAAPTSVALTSAAFPIGGNINSYNILIPYTWNGTTSDFTVGANWTPPRTPSTLDQLIFNGSTTPTPTVTNIPTQTVYSVSFINNVAATLNAAAAANMLTINTASSDNALTIATGSSLTLGTTTTLLLAHGANTGQISTIAGTLTLANAATFNAFGSVTTVSGTIVNSSAATTPLPSVSSTNLLFTTTGTYQHNINGGSMPAANYASTSTINVTGITTSAPTPPASCGNFIWNCATQTGTLLSMFSTLVTINGNVTITSTGTGSFLFGSGTPPTVSGLFKIDGGTLIAGGGTFTLNGGLTLNGGTITSTGGGTTTFNLKGNISQGASSTITGNASFPITFGFVDNISQTLNLLAGTNTGTINYTINNTAGVVLPGNLTVAGALNLTAGFLNLNGNTLTINGTTSVTSGSIRGSSTSNISIGGTGTMGTISFDQTTDGTTNVLNTFTLNRLTIGTATLGSKLVVLSTATLTAGTLNTGGFLTLRSTSLGTARIPEITGAISGTVTTETFIPAGRRAFRFLGHPFSTVQNMSSLTDDIYVTGAGAGFDATTTSSPSAFWFDNTATSPGAWTAFTSTSDNSWTQYRGIRVLARGDRTQPTALTGGNPTPLAATLDITGTLNTGAANISVPTAGAFHLVSNPYPSSTDIGTVIDALTAPVIGNQYWVWDANAMTKGAYITKTVGSGAYNLAMNGAFFVQPVSATTLAFAETNKTATATNALFRTTAPKGLVELQLLYNNYPADNLFVKLNEQAKTIKDVNDGEKLLNSDLNFYTISSDTKKLSLDARPLDKEDVIKLGLTTTVASTFKIKVVSYGLSADVEMYLKDKYTNTLTKLDANTEYEFTVSSNTQSQGENRFELVMKQVPMPLVSNSLEVKISPNPVKDQMYISYNNPEQGNAVVRISNGAGQVVKTIQLGKQQQGNEKVSMKGMVNGVYNVELTIGKERITKQVVKH